MAIPQFTNDASSTLASAITSTATSLTLTTGGGAKFPALTGGNTFTATIISQSNPNVYEIIKVTAITGDTFTTIVRDQEGTTNSGWNPGDLVNLQITAGALNAFAAASNAVLSVTGGTNITVNNANPQAPVVTAPGVALLSGASFTGAVVISNTLTTTGVANFNTSTRLEKTHVKNLKVDKTKFMNLRPITYIHKASGLPSIGFSAEDIAELHPELVQYKKGKPYAVNYSGIIPVACKMIQEQQHIIDALNARIEKLKRHSHGSRH